MAGKYCSSRECSYWRYRSSPRGPASLATSTAIMSYMVAVGAGDIAKVVGEAVRWTKCLSCQDGPYAGEDCQNGSIERW